MYFTLFVTVVITAVFLVVAAYVTAKILGPRSYNKVKGEPFECGIPTKGSSWLPMHVGYYLFAILFLMFDVETVFLYPWAVVVKSFGTMALTVHPNGRLPCAMAILVRLMSAGGTAV
mgnify:CR=1 FL=1